MRDFQKSKVYKWESAQGIWSSEKLSNEQATSLIRKVEKYCCCPIVPRILFRKRVLSRGGSLEIKLDSSPTIWLVIHEIAHHVAYVLNEGDKHGPKFVRLLIGLLHHYKVADRKNLLRSAKVSKIKVAPTSAIKQIKNREGRRQYSASCGNRLYS